MKTIFDELQQEVKNWWISLILGILYVIVAISLMFSPLSGYAVLSILFSVSMLFSGLLEISFAVSNRRRVSSWGWYLAGGIIDMILGFYLITYPMLSMEVIPFIIAFWLMFRGFSSVGYAMDLKRYGTRDWGWYVAFGILAVICSLIILWQPAVGALYAVYMISFAFLIIGFFRIMLSFELKNLHKRGKEWKEKKEKEVSPRRWGFGMGGGSVTAGTSNSLNTYALKNTSLTDQELLFLNSANFENSARKTNVKHKTPVSLGMSVSYSLNNRFALVTGLNYSLLSSSWETSDAYHNKTSQKLHFIGIPLSLTYRIAEWKRFQVYAAAGVMTEVNVAGKLVTKK